MRNCGISSENTERNTTAYIQNWVSRLEEDNRLIVHAAANAQRSVDSILGTSFVDPDTNEEQTTEPHVVEPPEFGGLAA